MRQKRIIRSESAKDSKWISVMGFILVLLACLALCAIIFYLVIPYVCKDRIAELPAATVNAMMISCITLSVTLSIAVPWMMSKSQINTVVERTVKKYYDKDFSQTIQKTHNTLFKAYANDSRMIAYFLCRHEKPLWALGWVCKSSTTYDRVQDNNQHKTYTALAVSNVFVLIDCVLQINKKLPSSPSSQLEEAFKEVVNKDNDEKINQVAIRTTRDLIKFCATIELRDRDYANVFEDKAGKDIPETLNDSLRALLNCLVLYLSTLYKDLFGQLELENEEDEYADAHKALFNRVIKECKEKKLEDLIKSFCSLASSLDEKYSDYLENRK